MNERKKKLIVLSGAGVSAESGIETFRDADGLWEGHDVKEVATPEGWRKNAQLVLNFYNERRKQLHNVQPNQAHRELVKLEEKYNVTIITQNIDDLHERAGSSHVIHLHGELLKGQSDNDPEEIFKWPGDMNIGDVTKKGVQIRPHVVWFGEAVPMLEIAAMHCAESEILIVVGSSMQVYPAASLAGYAPKFCDMYYVDPKPAINFELAQRPHLKIIQEKAGVGIPNLVNELLKN